MLMVNSAAVPAAAGSGHHRLAPARTACAQSLPDSPGYRRSPRTSNTPPGPNAVGSFPAPNPASPLHVRPNPS